MSRLPEPIERRSPKDAPAGYVLAVLLVNGRYALQLRDARSEIPDPGVWALFGGGIERGEAPEAALVREIDEELGIRLTEYRFLRRVERSAADAATRHTYWVFESDITAFWGRRRLAEGQAANCFSFEQLQGAAIPAFIRGLLERHYAEMTLQRVSAGGLRRW